MERGAERGGGSPPQLGATGPTVILPATSAIRQGSYGGGGEPGRIASFGGGIEFAFRLEPIVQLVAGGCAPLKENLLSAGSDVCGCGMSCDWRVGHRQGWFLK